MSQTAIGETFVSKARFGPNEGVILSVAVFQAERRISLLTGLARKANRGTLIHQRRF
jgi:hypothetical protein